MERAARLFKNEKCSLRLISDDAIIRGVWPAAVGNVIARHTCSLKVVRQTLVAEMEDSVWQKQLFGLRDQILRRLHKVMGSSDIQAVEFRAASPAQRRKPASEAELHPVSSVPPPCAKPTDEADSIQDPVLQKVFRLSRKRATA
jgi:hypothetical protein